MVLLYENIAVSRYGKAFIDKVNLIAGKLDFPANWLMAVMKNESGINHKATNPSGATGLIQFMPATARGLHTTTEALLQMSALEQLDYVYAYFLPFKKKINQAEDLYIATFYPYAFGKPDTYIIGSEVSVARARTIARQNPSFDLNKDGLIHLAEFKASIRAKTFKDLPSDQFKKKALA